MPNFGWNWSVEPVGGWSQLEHSDTCWCKLSLNGRKQPDPVLCDVGTSDVDFFGAPKHADTRTLEAWNKVKTTLPTGTP